jgi:hypothetical protein
VCISVVIKKLKTAVIVAIKLTVGIISKGFISLSYKGRYKSI